VDVFSRADLREIVGIRDGPCISLYMPMDRADIQQNPIRFKNRIRDVEHELSMKGYDTRYVDRILEPARTMQTETSYWFHSGDGLALFLAPNFLRRFRLPLSFPALSLVMDRFHIKPLLPLMSRDGRYYVLAVSQNRVRVLQGSYYGLRDVDLGSVPRSLADALKYDQFEKQLQYHTGTPRRTGDAAAVFHGQGVGTDDSKENVQRYFREIDRGLHNLLHDEEAPLVFAGVDYLFPIYREVNSYPHLVLDPIVGNPDQLSAEELHEWAWTLVEPIFLEDMNKDRHRYEVLKGTNRSSVNLESIVQAAAIGRAALLFVALEVQCWGIFDFAQQRAYIHEKRQPADEDLLDFAAGQTLLHGGRVYALKPENMPSGESVAAVLRY
jgi:hypothetical protein